jgi:hypothetical protein
MTNIPGLETWYIVKQSTLNDYFGINFGASIQECKYCCETFTGCEIERILASSYTSSSALGSSCTNDIEGSFEQPSVLSVDLYRSDGREVARISPTRLGILGYPSDQTSKKDGRVVG